MINDSDKITISILTYNRSLILKELLDSILNHINIEIEIIVVDNNSSDDTQNIIRNNYVNIKYYRMQENIGVAARNVGIFNSSGNIVITLDDDILINEDFDISKIINLFKSRPEIGAICFKVLDYKTKKVCNWCHHYEKDKFCNIEFITDEITEGAVAFRKSAINISGYYPTSYFISHEGADLLCRLLDAGYFVIYSPEICVQHRSHEEGRKVWRRYYYDTRNQIWLATRNYPLGYSIKYLFKGLSTMLIYSIRDGYIRYWIKGICDGVAGLPNALKERKPISSNSIRILDEIALRRPSLIYLVKERLFKKGIRL